MQVQSHLKKGYRPTQTSLLPNQLMREWLLSGKWWNVQIKVWAHSFNFILIRDTLEGSWFIQILCEMIAEHAHILEIRYFFLVSLPLRLFKGSRAVFFKGKFWILWLTVYPRKKLMEWSKAVTMIQHISKIYTLTLDFIMKKDSSRAWVGH